MVFFIPLSCLLFPLFLKSQVMVKEMKYIREPSLSCSGYWTASSSMNTKRPTALFHVLKEQDSFFFFWGSALCNVCSGNYSRDDEKECSCSIDSSPFTRPKWTRQTEKPRSYFVVCITIIHLTCSSRFKAQNSPIIKRSIHLKHISMHNSNT